MTTAFKEWEVIVNALGAGVQTLIVRKGGIAEGPGGFQLAAHRFWLLPTRFHAQLEKTKPAASALYPAPAPANPTEVTLQFFAQIEHAEFVRDWPRVAALDQFHLWTEATVRERFDWSKPPGLHVLILRIHRLLTPFQLELTPQMAGCKSWVDLALAPLDPPSEPVLPQAEFSALSQQIRHCLGAS